MKCNENNPDHAELIYKFRALDTDENFERIKTMITTGEFWFSSLWNQNDALEGVYLADLNENDVADLFDKKNNVKICSFSRKEALKHPLMWAHYASGFKGVAIGVQVHCAACRVAGLEKNDVDYIDEFASKEDPNIVKIITQKTKVWEYEKETRLWINQEKESLVSVGTVKELHYFEPYKNVDNYKNVHEQSNLIQKYTNNLEELKKFCEEQRPEITLKPVKYNELNLING